MNIYSNSLLQVVLISYPLIIYLFYNSYGKLVEERKRNIFLDMCLFLSMYLIVIYSDIIIYNYCLIINIPIIIAYTLDKKLQAIILSILAILFYKTYFNVYIIYFILEYIFYYIVYMFNKKIKLSNLTFIHLFVMSEIITTIIIKPFLTKVPIDYNDILQLILLYVISNFCYMLLEVGEKLRNYSINLKEIEKEKQIRNTIFKITHEIKNPIAVCKGYLEMINLENTEKSKKYIENIKVEIEKTLILLQDFLSLNKIQINKDIIDVNMLLEENLENLENYAKAQNTILEYELIDDEIYINGDYNRLGQVIINIIKNSIEAINVKPGKIKVYTELNTEDIKIYFIDNGTGIPKDCLKKIKIQNFSSKNNGCGIGVLLSNEIIVAHQGELTYKSTLGKGTTTIVKLPLYKLKESN